jgi:hypothetical protein
MKKTSTKGRAKTKSAPAAAARRRKIHRPPQGRRNGPSSRRRVYPEALTNES